MQNIVIEKPYRFIPPIRRSLFAFLISWRLPRFMSRRFGVERFEYRGVDRLERSRAAGHGIVLAPNHCRPEDPFTIGMLCRDIRLPVYFMAARHLFETGRFQAWMVRILGAYSVHREGMDREAMNFTIEALTRAERPVVLFPEGTITRSNDRLIHFMDGVALMARRAAAARAKLEPPGKVVIHPVAIRYLFEGDWRQAIAGVLDDIERRLSWRPQVQLPIKERICKVGEALLTLKEFEYFGRPQEGGLVERQERLIERLFRPLEEEWLKGKRDPDVVQRVKLLRTAILADMLAGRVDATERARRWEQLADIYLAQQVAFYPPGYLDGDPSPERLLETVERFEEDLYDAQRVHRPYRAVIEVGEAIEVPPERERSRDGDPLMVQVKESVAAMLARLTAEVTARRQGSAAGAGVPPG